MAIRVNELLPHTKFEQRNALLDTSPCNPEEVLPVGLGESAIPFCNVGGDGQGGTIELVCEKEVSARKLLGQRADGIGKADGLLVDDELFKCECYADILPGRK